MKRRHKPKQPRVNRHGVASVPHKKFRRKEKSALDSLRLGAAPDSVLMPTHKSHGADPWDYD